MKPNSAAKALSDASTRSIGLVLSMNPEVFAVESYAMALIAGLGTELEKRDYSLLLRIVPDTSSALRIHRNWTCFRQRWTPPWSPMWKSAILESSCTKEHPESPVLVIADPSVTKGLPTLSSDEAHGARQIVDCLHELGHRHIARIAGPERFAHTFVRDRIFNEETVALGMRYDCLHSDYTPEQGGECTSRLLSFPDSPTAIVYDNDVMAIEGMRVALEQGLSVPDDISIVSWDDSFMCTVTTPSITALWRDIPRLGSRAVPMLFKQIDGEKVSNATESPYELMVRDSVAPPVNGE